MSNRSDTTSHSSSFPPAEEGTEGGLVAGRCLHEASFADLVERLFREFEDRLSLRSIVGVARQCREQLRGSPVGALPELTERLARERLTCLAEQASGGSG